MRVLNTGRLEDRAGRVCREEGLVNAAVDDGMCFPLRREGRYFVGNEDFCGFLFGDHERRGMAFAVVVIEEFLFAIAGNGHGSKAAMPIADHFAILQSNKSSEAYYG